MENNRLLNIEIIQKKLLSLGLNQSDIAKNLDVSREIVSKWFKNINFPKPKHLLNLGKILKLSFTELVLVNSSLEPIIEFRRAKTYKITPEHHKHAKSMGEKLEILVPYLPYPLLTVPAVLNKPTNDYEYIRNVVYYYRNQLGLDDNPLSVPKLIALLKSLNIILVPVLWGDKKSHRNALYIFLPSTSSSWIFVNLDTLITDFNFWISHELGHVISKNIERIHSESFNDSFAAEFLFPFEAARKLYKNIIELNRPNQIALIKNFARDYFVSPTCIYFQLEKYALSTNLQTINIGNDIHKINAVFNKSMQSVSDLLFVSKNRTSEEYIRLCEEEFGTPIFKALRKYSKDNSLSAGLIQHLFDISVIDAKSLQKALMDGVN